MYRKEITYTDYNGNERTEPFYFNLTKTEIARLEMSIPGGLEALVNRLIAKQNGKEIIDTFDMIIEMSYGEKSQDGRQFVKSHELYKAFKETEAYNQFFWELITVEGAAAEFVNGILPEEAREAAAKQRIEMSKGNNTRA